MQIYIRRRPPNGPPFRLFLSENYAYTGRCFPSFLDVPFESTKPLYSYSLRWDRICPKWLKKEEIYFLRKIYVSLSSLSAFCILETKKNLSRLDGDQLVLA